MPNNLPKNVEPILGFLVQVDKVVREITDCPEFEPPTDNVQVIEKGQKWHEEDGKKYNISYLGAIKWVSSAQTIDPENIQWAFPLDKNLLLYPEVGETVLLLAITDNLADKQLYYLPWSRAHYPNYRRNDNLQIGINSTEVTSADGNTELTKSYSTVSATKTPNQSKTPNPPGGIKTPKQKSARVKFLKPNAGDLIITGRGGNTMRFSQSYENETINPILIIRNGQSQDTLTKEVGYLDTENINQDGSTIYFSSGENKVPYNFTNARRETTIGFGNLPTDNKNSGHQIYLNSDRVVLSSKANEFIIFGKGQTGIITGDKFSIDATKDIYLYSDSDVTLHTAGKKMYLNSQGGQIYLGNIKENEPMVLGTTLVGILKDLIDQINAIVLASGCGPAQTPANSGAFNLLKTRLDSVVSKNNFVSL